MPESVDCELCGRGVAIHASYIVRIDVYADPTLPDISSAALAALDFDAAMEQIATEAESLSAEDLQDGVHRRFEYRLCAGCQKRFLANPLGKPRDLRAGKN